MDQESRLSLDLEEPQTPGTVSLCTDLVATLAKNPTKKEMKRGPPKAATNIPKARTHSRTQRERRSFASEDFHRPGLRNYSTHQSAESFGCLIHFVVMFTESHYHERQRYIQRQPSPPGEEGASKVNGGAYALTDPQVVTRLIDAPGNHPLSSSQQNPLTPLVRPAHHGGTFFFPTYP